jgi:hypothetical protein
MTREGRSRWRARAAVAAFPLVVRAINRAGVGPVRADLSGEALRRGGLHGIREACTRLGVGADQVVFGHTHRPGPLAADDQTEWRGLLNTGSWVLEAHIGGAEGARSPYRPGTAVTLEDGGVPEVVRLLDDELVAALRPRRG